MDKDRINELIYKARIAEQTERFDDMVIFMKEVIETEKEINEENRNLISIAYKNSVGQKRTAWRAIEQFQQKQQQNSNSIKVIEFYQNHLENEMKKQCQEIIEILDQKIFNKADQLKNQDHIFYLKMKADYNRYLCEFIKDNEENNVYKKEAEKNYEDAMEKAKQLQSYDIIRLGLALNYSVFHYEILGQVQQAINISRTAHESALLDIENFEDEQMKEATTVMQLLKDNQTNWENELNEEIQNQY